MHVRGLPGGPLAPLAPLAPSGASGASGARGASGLSGSPRTCMYVRTHALAGFKGLGLCLSGFWLAPNSTRQATLDSY